MRATAVLAGVVAIGSFASISAAAPMSDGSIFKETFTTYPEDPKSSGPGTGVNTAGGNAHIVTTNGDGGTDGAFRASPLGIAGNSEYVLDFDFSINANSGDNFYILLMEGSGAPYSSDIAIRAYNPGPGNGDFAFQVDFASGGYEGFNNKVFGQTYHMTVHHKADNTIALYLDDVLLNTYADRTPGIGTNLIQFGDGSGFQGFGDMTIDNVSIGAVAIPEPATMGALALAGLLATRRRR